MLAAARYASEGATVLETIQCVDVFPVCRPAATRERSSLIWSRNRDHVQARWMAVLVSPDGEHEVLARIAEVVNLARASELAGLLVTVGVTACAVPTMKNPHLGIIAAKNDQVRPDIAAVYRRIRNLEPLAQAPSCRVNDLNASLLPCTRLGHRHNLLVCNAKVHGKTRRIVQSKPLHLEMRPHSLAAQLREPAIAIDVQRLSALVRVEVCGPTPPCVAKEAPHRVAQAEIPSPSTGKDETHNAPRAEELAHQHAKVLWEGSPSQRGSKRAASVDAGGTTLRCGFQFEAPPRTCPASSRSLRHRTRRPA
mmetsp:Transcript_18407/g.50519  ORF Transcript_18407/g.50519 Transcript_18407/m.50519 type:complete len:309 (-) Transcript_18407:55-981(-)